MSWVAVAVAGASLVSGAISSDAARKAGNQAADAQRAAADAGIGEQRRQFDSIQELLRPYAQVGTDALGAQRGLIGLDGADAQQAAIRMLQSSPQFTEALRMGQDSILANASATGGLRGGNTQAALAQFAPALLAQAINDQYSRLGGMVSIGQNAAAMTGNAGMQTGSGIANLLQQRGAALAGGALAGGAATAGMANSVGNAIGLFGGLGGFSRIGGGGAGGVGGWNPANTMPVDAYKNGGGF